MGQTCTGQGLAMDIDADVQRMVSRSLGIFGPAMDVGADSGTDAL